MREGGSKSANITTQTTTLVHTGACVLDRIVFNAKTANGTVAFYDGLTAGGTLLGTITSPGTLLDNHQSLEYGMRCATGLTVVTGAANQNITVVVTPVA